MKRRMYRNKTRGQSIPLFALMFVVLAGFAALSLDAGNMYAQQRSVVRATNAAAIDGMNGIIEGQTLDDVKQRVKVSLNSNGVNAVYGPSQPNEVSISGEFLDASGNQLNTACNLGGDTSGCPWDSIKDRITYLRVSAGGYVATYFARVVGQDQLPVKAVAHATRGLCVEGVYPLAVKSEFLDMNTKRFDPPDAIYSDEYFRNKTQKRLFLGSDTTGVAGNFGWLRWNAADNSTGSAKDLGAALTNSGTLSDGFIEAKWPYDNKGKPIITQLEEPPGYPLIPNKLNSGDWIAGSSGLSNANEVRTQLDKHISNRTIMTLPIYDYSVGNGANGTFHVIDLGRFYIRGYGKVNKNTAESAQYGGQDGWYVDLVYLGRGGECASLNTGVVSSNLMAIEGQVGIVPHYARFPEASTSPIQYVVVLDRSGSMAWNFAGQAHVNGNLVTCQGSGAIECPPGSAYASENERRIAIAHQILLGFVNEVRPQDQVRIVTYSGRTGLYGVEGPQNPQEALMDLSQVYPDKWTSDKTILRDAINVAAGNYTPIGETPTAIGLARAMQVYENSNTIDPVTGQKYRRVVILLTDGVANVMRDGRLNWSASCGSETVSCQEGVFLDDPLTIKPIPAMQNEARALRGLITGAENGDGSVHVIALGQTSLAALTSVGDTVTRAQDASALETTMRAIRETVTVGACVPTARISPTYQVSGSAIPDYSIPALGGKLAYPELGQVILTGSSGQKYVGSILLNEGSGTMSYRINNIPPGQYLMTYWMAYKAEDGETRIYDTALMQGLSIPVSSYSVPLNPGADVLGAVSLPITMELDTEKVDVCLNAVRPI